MVVVPNPVVMDCLVIISSLFSPFVVTGPVMFTGREAPAVLIINQKPINPSSF